MSKETKNDRLVRTMMDQVTEHLHELKTLESGVVRAKESDIEKWCQSFLKNCFGFTSSSGYSIRSQEATGKMRADLIVYKGEKQIFLVEVKKPGFDLNKSDFRSGKTQLSEYLNAIGNVKWGILCNGAKWKLFDFSNSKFGGIEIASFDLYGEDETINLEKKAIEELCYEILDFHEQIYAAAAWDELSKEATAFSPESLAKAILSADVVKYVAKSIRGEHEYKANLEVLMEKVFWLLEEGLNDAIPGWNESKKAEYQKYLKSQKRASRKVKKSNKSETAEKIAAPEDPSENVIAVAVLEIKSA